LNGRDRNSIVAETIVAGHALGVNYKTAEYILAKVGFCLDFSRSWSGFGAGQIILLKKC
jgi:hypothetical protein